MLRGGFEGMQAYDASVLLGVDSWREMVNIRACNYMIHLCQRSNIYNTVYKRAATTLTPYQSVRRL